MKYGYYVRIIICSLFICTIFHSGAKRIFLPVDTMILTAPFEKNEEALDYDICFVGVQLESEKVVPASKLCPSMSWLRADKSYPKGTISWKKDYKKAVLPDTIHVRLPVGANRALIFKSNNKKGKLHAQIPSAKPAKYGYEETLDLYSDVEKDKEITVPIPPSTPEIIRIYKSTIQKINILTVVLFVILFLSGHVILHFKKNPLNVKSHQPQYISSIDGLRGIGAVVIACFYHYRENFTHVLGLPGYENELVYFFYSFGRIFVELFFMISGFVICYSYYERISSRQTSFQAFSLARIIRLYPMMWLTTIVMAILEWIYIYLNKTYWAYKYNDIYHLLLNLLGTGRGWFDREYSLNVPLWTISVELVCYIIIFIIFYKCKTFSQVCASLFIMVLFALGINGFHAQNDGPFIPLINTVMSRGYMTFFTGALLCMWWKNSSARQRDWSVDASFCILAVVFLLVHTIPHSIYGNKTAVFSLLIWPCFILITLNSYFFNRLLSGRFFQWLGRISFSLYIWNFPIQLLWVLILQGLKIKLNYSSPEIFGIHLVVSLFVAWISYRYFETPITKMLKSKTGNIFNNRQVS